MPGDKSISHRALILGALAVGETRISGLLEGEDVINTAKAMRALGATVERVGEGVWRVDGVGVAGFATPAAPLDFGNSGTGCRLMMGAVAGCPITATFDGDASLRKRPMQRVLDPLARMGAQASSSGEGGRLPLTLQGARDPIPIVYEPPAASAQLKSAVLLAGLGAPGETTVIEKEATRDHTERMLRHFGAEVTVESIGARPAHHAQRPARACAAPMSSVPADPSSAAFPLVAALIVPGSEIVLEGVMTNPLRTGLFKTLREMGASIDDARPRATTAAKTSPICGCALRALKGVEVPAERAPTMIDEYPVLAVAAAFAEGTTRDARPEGTARQGIRSARRHRRHAARQRRRGRDRGRRPDRARPRPRRRAAARSRPTWITASPCRRWSWGSRSDKPVQADDVSLHRDELPGFAADDARSAPSLSMIIAIDGPAASGKGTLAKRLAAHFGLPHLDTGLIYRAVAKALLDAGHKLDDRRQPLKRRHRARSLTL